MEKALVASDVDGSAAPLPVACVRVEVDLSKSIKIKYSHKAAWPFPNKYANGAPALLPNSQKTVDQFVKRPREFDYYTERVNKDYMARFDKNVALLYFTR
jgi:hypothetical protein